MEFYFFCAEFRLWLHNFSIWASLIFVDDVFYIFQVRSCDGFSILQRFKAHLTIVDAVVIRLLKTIERIII